MMHYLFRFVTGSASNVRLSMLDEYGCFCSISS